jgi:tetratricopeptide (TPR) repeat protein
LPHLEEAARLFSQLGDPATEAYVCDRIAAAYERRGDFAAALAAWARVRVLRQEIGDAAGELRSLEGLVRVTRRHVDEPALALEYCAQALTLARSLADPAAQGRLHNTMGILEWSRGEYPAALAHYEAALHLFDALNDDASAGLMRNSIGVTLRAIGRPDQALALLTDAVERHRLNRHALLEGHALGALAELWEARGEFDNAHECYTRSLELRRALGDRRGEGWMLCGISRVHQARGATDAARASLAQATTIAQECADTELADTCERLRRAPGP